MRVTALSLLAGLALAACSDRQPEIDLTNASIALTTASNDAAAGRPVDYSQLLALPGLDAALIDRAERAKKAVQGQMPNPGDPIWGDIWTPDLVMICGTVNGRGSDGAIAPVEVFYAPDGTSARLPGGYQYDASDLENCWKGAHHRVIIPADRPPA